MADKPSKLNPLRQLLGDDDPTDCSPIPGFKSAGTSQTSTDTTDMLAKQKREIEELRQSIGTMSNEIDRLQKNLGKKTPTASTESQNLPVTSDPQTVNRILLVLNSAQRLKYPLFKDCMTVGRSPDNDIHISTEYVSRAHARIISDEDGATIEDLNSRNGILVNSRRVTEHRLRNGDIIALGKMQLKFIDLMEAGSVEGHS